MGARGGGAKHPRPAACFDGAARQIGRFEGQGEMTRPAAGPATSADVDFGRSAP